MFLALGLLPWLGLTPVSLVRRGSVALRRRLAATYEMCPDGIVCADAEGFVRVWNAAAARILGWTTAETMGQPLPRPAGTCFESLERELPTDGYPEKFLACPRSGGVVTGVRSRISRWNLSGGWMAFVWENAAG